jgi:hypothetical protein
MLNFMLNYMYIFILGFLLHLFILYMILNGFMGNNIKYRVSIMLKKNISLFFIVPFFIYLFTIIYLEYNVIYLDNIKPISVTTSMGNTEIELTGSFFNSIFSNLGAAGVFAASARISAALVSKHSMNLLPKIGVIGGTSAGFTAVFKLINYSIPNNTSVQANIPTGVFKLKCEVEDIKSAISNSDSVSNTLKNTELKNILDRWGNELNPFFLKKNNSNSFKELSDRIEFNSNVEQSSKALEEVNKIDPNWVDKTINSPLEKGDMLNISHSFKDQLLEILSTNLTLHFIIVYLSFMLILIFTSKLILEKGWTFNKIKDLPLPFGINNFISSILTRMINVWKLNSNVWIYFIMVTLFIFNCASTYSIHQIYQSISNI